MDFEWHPAKERTNVKKHNLDFATASRVFLDPHAVEIDDDTAHDEFRFNAIGMVDGRLLFVTCTLRGDTIRIISARGAVGHEKKRYHEI